MQQKTGEIEQNSIKEMDSLIASIQKAKPGTTEEGICVALNYNEGYIAQARSRKNVSQKFIDTLKRYLTTLQNANTPEEAEPTAMQLMKIIVETNENIRKDHSELISLHKQIVETNAKLADTNSELARKIPDATAGAPSQNDLIVETIRAEALGLLFEIGAGKRWHSTDEVKAAWNKRISEAMGLGKETGTQTSSGRTHKAK